MTPRKPHKSTRFNMAKTVAIANFKGGVGKTTSAVNIGAALSSMGLNVLLVDMDAQFNLTQTLGASNDGGTVYNALRGEAPEVVEIYEGLYVLPSSLELIKAEIELAGEFRREEILSKALQPLYSRFDWIIFDCPPSLGLLTLNAFVASDRIIVPIEAEYLALTGYAILSEALSKVGMEIDAVFITKYDARKILNRNVLEGIKSALGGKALETVIRENVALAEAPARYLDIFRYSPKSTGAEDYLSLTKEIVKLF